jgi:hypothetical protein
MVSGQTGKRGHLVLLRVVEVANHENVRVQALHQPMVDKTVRERAQRHKHVEQNYVQVSKYGEIIQTYTEVAVSENHLRS